MNPTGADWELLQRDVDGETSPDERAALQRRLAAEPALRARHEELLGLARRLGAVSLQDPPEGLRLAILQAVRQAAGRRPSASPSPPWALLARRPALALAATLALGVGAGVVLSGLLGGGPWPAVDESSVAGTVLSGGRIDLPVVDRARLEGAGLRAEVEARAAGGLVVAEVVIEPPGAAELYVGTGGSGLAPRGFLAQDGLPATGAVLEAEGVYVADAPPGWYRLVLAPVAAGSGEVRIRLESSDGGVEGRLRLGPVPAPAPAHR